MCGIWAYISKNKKNNDIQELLKNFWSIKNRGPDNSVFETFETVMMGFHRLAIMDNTFKSNQPFHFQNELKTVIFICNGEIYNYKELNHKYDLNLENNSDCMTIPLLYMKLDNEDLWLELFKKEIKGEFAFIMCEFDNFKNLRKVFVGRDQIGIRPLYYNGCSVDIKNNKDQFVFCSEIKGLRWYNDNVEEFPPGKILRLNFDEFKNTEMSFYDFKWVYNVLQVIKDENYYLDNVRRAVINSVRRRLVADRPLAFLLSGGVDSSLVCAISQKILNQPINTFCCGMGKGTDLKYAKMVADHIKSHHTEVLFTEQEGFDSIPDVIEAIESWDTTTVRASVGQFLVSKFIGTNTDCKVVLVGEGPDEVCSSYMFNWNAPSGKEMHIAALKYVDEIHYYDSKRGDRCISHWGLEGRVPLLDPEVIEAYWRIPSDMRLPKTKGIEKWWLRQAFTNMNLLPDEVLWRKKEAFSDGVSSKEKSWYEIIQEKIDLLVPENYKELSNKYVSNKPVTKEAYYFLNIFTNKFGMNRDNIIPGYWQPMWSGKEGEYIDPSARILDAYTD